MWSLLKISIASSTTSTTFNNSFFGSGISAKSEKAVAMELIVSICWINESLNSFILSLLNSWPLLKPLSKVWILSLIGVKGFFISCATCLAISLHAVSLSLFASLTALLLSSSIIVLYESINATTSLGVLSILILTFWFWRFVFLIVSPIESKDFVTKFEIKYAMTNAIKIIFPWTNPSLIKNPVSSCLLLVSSAKYGIYIIPSGSFLKLVTRL